MTLIKRWQTKGGKHWFELHAHDVGFSYRCDGGGGYLGTIDHQEAVAKIEKMIADAKTIDGINYYAVN